MKEKALRFAATGAFGTILDIGLLYFFVESAGLPVILSNTLSFLVVIAISFFIHKRWTFKNKSVKIPTQFLEYFGVSLVGLGISNLLLFVLLKAEIWYLLGKIITVFVVFFWSFLANNFFTFKRASRQRVAGNSR